MTIPECKATPGIWKKDFPTLEAFAATVARGLPMIDLAPASDADKAQFKKAAVDCAFVGVEPADQTKFASELAKDGVPAELLAGYAAAGGNYFKDHWQWFAIGGAGLALLLIVKK